MMSRFNIDSIYCNKISILLIFWLDGNLTAEGKSPFVLEGIWSTFNRNWSCIISPHVNIEQNFLKLKSFRFLHVNFPSISFLDFSEWRLLLWHLYWVVSDLNINNTLQHLFYFFILSLFLADLRCSHLFNKFIM